MSLGVMSHNTVEISPEREWAWHSVEKTEFTKHVRCQQ